MIRELYVIDYLHKHLPNVSEKKIEGLLSIDPEDLRKDLHFRVVEYQKFCYDLAQQAINSRLVSINNVLYKGQGYNVDDKELEDSFKTQLNTLQQDLFGDNNLLTQYGYFGMGGGMGGMGYGMGYGGMGMGYGMGMMGMGGMGMMGMGGMGPNAYLAMDLRDPETDEPPQTGRKESGDGKIRRDERKTQTLDEI